jgi:cation transport ATPase
MSTAPHVPQHDPAVLRAEHDALARRLEIRGSIDVARRGAYQIFAGLIAVGAAVALAWDRWGTLKPGLVRKVMKGPPVFLYLATAAAVILMLLAIRSFLRARRMMREEDALYARFRALRDALGLEA